MAKVVIPQECGELLFILTESDNEVQDFSEGSICPGRRVFLGLCNTNTGETCSSSVQ